MTIDNNENGRVRDERINNLREDVSDNKASIAILAKEIVDMKINLAKLAERMALFQLGQGIFTILSSGIAMYIAYVLTK